MHIQIYQKETKQHLLKLMIEGLGNLHSSRFLAYQLAKRDISGLYRQSLLGMLWAFVTPIITAAVWVVLSASGTVKLSETGIPYPLYVFTGTLLWSIIADSIISPIKSTEMAKTILTKINFPKEALIVSGILKLLFNSFIKMLLLLLFVLLYGTGINWTLLLFPLAVFGGVVVGNTIGLLLTPIGMLYQDISKMITLVMPFLMYATPVVYAKPETGLMHLVMELNPLTPIVTVGRNLAVGLPLSDLTFFLCVVGGCVPLFLFALVLYRISIPIFVERLSA